jgi:hypothetical protein
VKLALTLVLLSGALGCSSSDDESSANDDRVAYRLDGALKSVHNIEAAPGMMSESLDQPSDAWGQARIGCSLVNETDKDPSRGQVFVLSAVENYGEEHGAGIYLKVQQFGGVGQYALDTGAGGRAWVFDKAHIQACARAGDTSCFQGVEGCTVDVTRWDFTPGAAEKPAGYPEPVTVGIAEGTFTCRRLVNGSLNQSVSITTGTFKCHAGDWTKQ